MNQVTKLKENFKVIREQIAVTAQDFNRAADSVALLAVSKIRTSEEILALAEQGQRHFGENYVQEALKKIHTLRNHRLHWHFIGNIQANKTKAIAENFHWVHTLDREKVARRLNEQRPKHLPPLNVCIAVNISNESSKTGIPLEALPALAQAIAQLPKLRLRGLMALPAPTNDYQQQRKPFKQLAQAAKQLQPSGIVFDTLSMGTTADYKAAIAEGATLIRIGTAIFGPRPQSEKNLMDNQVG